MHLAAQVQRLKSHFPPPHFSSRDEAWPVRPLGPVDGAAQAEVLQRSGSILLLRLLGAHQVLDEITQRFARVAVSVTMRTRALGARPLILRVQ